MKIEDVDVVGTQAAQAPLDGSQDGGPRESLSLRLRAGFHAGFSGENEVVSPPVEKTAQHLFRRAVVIRIGRIEKVDAVFAADADHSGRGILRGLASERHGAKADTGDEQLGVL